MPYLKISVKHYALRDKIVIENGMNNIVRQKKKKKISSKQ